MKIPISVLVVIYNTSGDVLLIERADRHNFWQSVTGSLDDLNESLRAAAEREVFEETGIQVAALNPTALQDMHHQVEYEIYPQWRIVMLLESQKIASIGFRFWYPKIAELLWRPRSTLPTNGYCRN